MARERGRARVVTKHRIGGTTIDDGRGMEGMALQLPSDQDATGRTLGASELRYLEEAIASGTLTSTKGRFVKELESTFAKSLGSDFVTACSSGTAAVHTAVAAIDPEPGDEIITTPITDMGALAPILYQGAIPVFADVDPVTGNITPEAVSASLSERTKAIIVTHLFGNPADVEAIVEIAEPLGIPVVEDAAQAFGASVSGRPAGTIGAIGCFSLQQGKHITTGEGGLVATSDPAHARRIRLFVNKAWPYGEAAPDHEFLALNYRMSELQGAVGLAQLDGLGEVVRKRTEMASLLTDLIGDVWGIAPPTATEGSVHSYWRYCLTIDRDVIPGGPDAMAAALRSYDVASAPRYVRKPAFECRVFTDQRTFGESRWPFVLARPEAVDYSPDLFPGTYDALASMLVLPFNERYGREHIEYLAASIADAAMECRS
jgi:perosamine synthetase